MFIRYELVTEMQYIKIDAEGHELKYVEVVEKQS